MCSIIQESKVFHRLKVILIGIGLAVTEGVQMMLLPDTVYLRMAPLYPVWYWLRSE